jgi:LssY C-terminus
VSSKVRPIELSAVTDEISETAMRKKPIILLILITCSLAIISPGTEGLSIAGQSQSPIASPLIKAIVHASREDHPKRSLQYLEQAKGIIGQGADLKARDPDQRTALHWVVIGAISARNEKQLQAYLDLTQLLITRGAEINAEDDFGNTPLDWQAASPRDEILHLLLDHGARGGKSRDEAAIFNRLLSNLSSAVQTKDLNQIRAAMDFNLPSGSQIQIRLTSAVSTENSKSGDPVEAVVIAPVVAGDRVVIEAGMKIQGAIMSVQKATADNERAQLILNFANLIYPKGDQARLLTQVTDVDNARETVQAGRIIGIPYPNHSNLTWATRLLGVTDPILSDCLLAALFIRDKEYKREIDYPPGVEMTLNVEAPVKLPESRNLPAWPELPLPSQLLELVRAQPVQTRTSGQTPSDLTNLLILGSGEKIEAAFQAAGWQEAGKLSISSGLKTFIAVAEDRGYKSAPVSLLLLDDKRPDLAYQKQNDTFAKRHHIRLWKRPVSYQGEEVWVAAATHDIAIAVHREGTQWIHVIDSYIDRERTKVSNDLMFTGLFKGCALVDRPAAPRQSSNATGDKLITDGKMMVLGLK